MNKKICSANQENIYASNKQGIQTSTPPPIDLLKATLSGGGALEMLMPSCWAAVLLTLLIFGYRDTWPTLSTTTRRLLLDAVIPADDDVTATADGCWWCETTGIRLVLAIDILLL